MDSILSGLFLLFITVLIIFFAYYITTIIGKKTSILMENRYVQVLEKTSLGLNINIEIIKINKKIYIVATQGKTIELLDTINESEWEYINAQNNNLFTTKKKMPNILKNKEK